MATQKGKPTGWFKYILAIDCETTGLKFNGDDCSEGHQALSWGVIVADAETLLPIEKLYLEIKWNDDMLDKREADPKFGVKAESIHGLTLEYLEDNGITEEEAVVQLGNLILKYFADGNIRTLGHNVHLFDLYFLKSMFRRHGIELKFGSRHIDTSSLGYVCFGVYDSDQLFKECGFEARGQHNALEDIEMTLDAARIIRVVFQAGLEG